MRKKKPEFTGKMKLKKGDEVMILAGKDKGKSGKIIETLPEEGKVRVDGVNLAKKHQKPKSANSRAMVKQQLGEVQLPMGLCLAKVMLVCPKCNKETKLASERNNEGKNVRKCRKCGEMIDG